LTLADLRIEYQKWLGKHASSRRLLKLVDPFIGEDLTSKMTDGRFKFVVDLQPVRIKEIAKASPQQNDASRNVFLNLFLIQNQNENYVSCAHASHRRKFAAK
jgi:hypothetical protein